MKKVMRNYWKPNFLMRIILLLFLLLFIWITKAIEYKPLNHNSYLTFNENAFRWNLLLLTASLSLILCLYALNEIRKSQNFINEINKGKY